MAFRMIDIWGEPKMLDWVSKVHLLTQHALLGHWWPCCTCVQLLVLLPVTYWPACHLLASCAPVMSPVAYAYTLSCQRLHRHFSLHAFILHSAVLAPLVTHHSLTRSPTTGTTIKSGNSTAGGVYTAHSQPWPGHGAA